MNEFKATDKWYKDSAANETDIPEISAGKIDRDDREMNKIFIVTLGAENRYTILEWAFKNYEDAARLVNHLDKDKGASSTPSSIREINLFDKYPLEVENET